MDGLTLAGEFATATREQWLRLVDKVLKGADPGKRLVSRTRDGIEIHPLYLRDSAPADASGWPGSAPMLRGGTSRANHGGWDIRQRHAHPDPDLINERIREDLDGGVGSILLRIDTAFSIQGEPPDGCCAVALDDLDRALAGVDLATVPVALEGGRWGINAALLVALWQRRGIPLTAVRGELGVDPLSVAARGLALDIDRGMARAGELIGWTASRSPGVAGVRADGHLFHAGGASEAQELAAALASAVAYLRAAEAAGVEPSQAAGQIAFRLAADTDIFLTVAKLRAARWLWARVQQACGHEPVPMRLHALAATRIYTRRDVANNLLRGALAALGAGLGGADAITVLPLDHALGLPGPLARRLARNTHHVLLAESGLDRVIDPLGGAWFVEDLTRRLANEAWSLFQAIESGGGMVDMLRRGTVHDWVVTMRDQRWSDIARRRESVVGVSDFPWLEEAGWQPERFDPAPLVAGAEERLRDAGDTAGRSFDELVAISLRGGLLRFHGSLTSYTPLPPIRLGQPFERLRDRSDAIRGRTGARPAATLLCLGPPREHGDRAAFARNLLAAGGLDVLDHPGRPASGSASVAVLCGSDRAYAEEGDAALARLGAAGHRAVWWIGSGDPATLNGAGRGRPVAPGDDVIAVLEDMYDAVEQPE